MRLDILIPTYNRHIDLLRNLTLLKGYILKSNLQSDIKIIISDNCSPDLTEISVNAFLKENSQELKIEYFRQSENVGLENNAVTVLSKSTSSYIMFLGDDDYLPQGYIEYCLEKINNRPEIGCIIPGLSSLLEDGTVIEGRKENFKEKALDPGYKSVWLYSHLGHQMSGVLFKRSGLLEDYLRYPEYRNIYLFIYFVTNRLFKFHALYVPEFKVKVSTFNVKDWSYNQIGLLDEVFKSYYPFIDQFGENRIGRLMIRFAVMHAYRLEVTLLTIKKIFVVYRSMSAKVRPVGKFRLRLLFFLIKEYLKKFI
jgi:glycosyltransferase involved in cell wall biosynthesis